MARSERIAAILADEDFQWAIERVEAQLTRKVMSASTSQEDRETALRTFHGLKNLMGLLRAVETDKEETT